MQREINKRDVSGRLPGKIKQFGIRWN